MDHNVKLLIGSHGSGKSKWLYEYIVKNAVKDNKLDLSKKLFLVVPEQETQAKQNIMMQISKNLGYGQGLFNIDVISFDRMCHIVFDILGISPKEESIIEDDAKTMILVLALSKLCKNKKLKYYKKMLNNIGFAKNMTKVVSEFYSYGIMSEDIDKVINDSSKDNFKDKLNDLKIIQEEFKKTLQEKNFFINEDKLNLLNKNISKVDFFKNSIIAFEGFTGFTPIQMEIFKKIAMVAKEVFVAIDIRDTYELYPNKNKNENTKISKSDLFYLSKKFVNDIAKALSEIKKELPFENYLDFNTGENIDDKNYISGVKKFNNKKDLEHLEKNIYKLNNKFTSDIKLDNIKLFCALNINEEILNVVHEIKKLIKTNEYKYNDIKIIVPSIEDYKDSISKIFNKYNIPFFLDDETPLLNSPYIETIRAAIDVISRDFTYESVMRYINAGIINKNDSINLFENFIIEYGIRGHKRYQDGFEKIAIKLKKKKTKKTISNKYLDEIDKIIEFKNNAINPLLNLYEKMRSRHSIKSIYSFNDSLKEFLEEIKLNENFKLFLDEFEQKNIDNKSILKYKKIFDMSEKVTNYTLENIYTICSGIDEKISIDNFKKLLDVGFVSRGVKLIPFSLDQVVIGDLMRSRFENPKIQFILGLNSSKVPASSIDKSIIDDGMRDAFAKLNILLSQTTIETAFNQRFYIYLILTNPTDKLILSYTKKNANSEYDEKSSVIVDIQNMFGNIDKEKNKFISHLIEEKVDINKFPLLTKFDIEKYIYENIYNFKYEINDFKNLKNKENDLKKFYDYLCIIKYAIENNIISKEEMLNLINENEYIKEEKINNVFAKEFLKGFDNLEDDVISATQVERYNHCPYKYFLEYAVKLKERKSYHIRANDLGGILHKVFEMTMKNENFSLKDAELTTIKKEVSKAVEIAVSENDKFLVADSTDNEYFGKNKILFIKNRIENIIIYSMVVLQKIIKLSKFNSFEYEEEFEYVLEECVFKGKIDKVEKFDEDGNMFINIIDYKSGKTNDIKVENVQKGIDIQLVAYLDSCINNKFDNNDNLISCGAYYFKINDNLIKLDYIYELNDLEQKKYKNFSYNGIMSNDDIAIKTICSNLKPYDKNKYSNNFGFEVSGLKVDKDNLDALIKDMKGAITTTVKNIKDGSFEPVPFKSNIECTYCKFVDICKKGIVIIDNIDENGEKDDNEN